MSVCKHCDSPVGQAGYRVATLFAVCLIYVWLLQRTEMQCQWSGCPDVAKLGRLTLTCGREEQFLDCDACSREPVPPATFCKLAALVGRIPHRNSIEWNQRQCTI